MDKKSRRHSHRLRGYRLHDARITYSQGTDSVRTIKYELIHPDQSIFNAAAASIRHDYCSLYGNVALDDYFLGPKIYSLMDFWLDTLRLGGVFAYDAQRLASITAQAQGKASDSEKLYESIPASLRHKFMKEEWTSFFTKPKRKTGSEKTKTDSLVRQFDRTVNQNSQFDHDVMVIRKRYVESILHLSAQDQPLFIAELFQIPTNFLPIKPNRARTSFLTCYLEPDLTELVNQPPTNLMREIYQSRQIFF